MILHRSLQQSAPIKIVSAEEIQTESGSAGTSNYLLYMDASTCRLCCYYEMEKFEEAFMELDKLKHYMRNHKEIPDVHRAFNYNFLIIYQKLLKGITNPEKFEIGYLKKDLTNESAVSKKFWLLEKIADVEN